MYQNSLTVFERARTDQSYEEIFCLCEKEIVKLHCDPPVIGGGTTGATGAIPPLNKRDPLSQRRRNRGGHGGHGRHALKVAPVKSIMNELV